MFRRLPVIAFVFFGVSRYLHRKRLVAREHQPSNELVWNIHHNSP